MHRNPVLFDLVYCSKNENDTKSKKNNMNSKPFNNKKIRRE
jgi:hypothetical protein